MQENRPLPNDHLDFGYDETARRPSDLPLYEAPSVFSYTDEDILDQLGPARLIGSNGGTGEAT